MLGGLHIEMAMINVIGLLLESSGWCETMSASGLTTVGRAQSLTGASHIKNARYAHQATCATLHSLMKDAYLKDMEASVEKNKETFEQWQKRCRNEYPLFAFWAMILELEVLYNIFIRALREGNFKMHLEVLVELMPWLCALTVCTIGAGFLCTYMTGQCWKPSPQSAARCSWMDTLLQVEPLPVSQQCH